MADIPEPIKENLIIGLSVGFGSAVLTCIVVLVILFCRSKRKEKEAQKNAQDQCPSLSPVPPVPECSLNPQGTVLENESKRKGNCSAPHQPAGEFMAIDQDSNPATGEEQVYPSTSYIQRPPPSDVEHQITSGGVKVIRLPEDYHATCPPMTMAPFRSQSLAGLPGSNRPSTIAGLPTFSHANLTWGRKSEEGGNTIKRRASDVSSLRAKQMFDSEQGKREEHRRKPIEKSTMFTKGLYRNQCNPEHLLEGSVTTEDVDVLSCSSDLPEELYSEGEELQHAGNTPTSDGHMVELDSDHKYF